MVQLTRRNTRRYGGYIVHFGIVVMFVGLAGSAFNRNVEKELGFGQSMDLGPYHLVCQSFTQETSANYDTEFSLIDVYRGGKKQFQLAPEKRFYQSSQQTQTMVANHSTPLWDLYLVYEGKNPETWSADYQGLPESADHVDMDRRWHCGVRNRSCTGTEYDGCAGLTEESRSAWLLQCQRKQR